MHGHGHHSLQPPFCTWLPWELSVIFMVRLFIRTFLQVEATSKEVLPSAPLSPSQDCWFRTVFTFLSLERCSRGGLVVCANKYELSSLQWLSICYSGGPRLALCLSNHSKTAQVVGLVHMGLAQPSRILYCWGQPVAIHLWKHSGNYQFVWVHT